MSWETLSWTQGTEGKKWSLGMKSVIIIVTSLSSGSFNIPRNKACQHMAEEQEDGADPTPRGTEGLRAGGTTRTGVLQQS